jgi:hypothetical protein
MTCCWLKISLEILPAENGHEKTAEKLLGWAQQVQLHVKDDMWLIQLGMDKLPVVKLHRVATKRLQRNGVFHLKKRN